MKKLVWLGMIVGSVLGGMIPGLWGADMFSFSSVIFNAIGALVGIWVGYRLSQY